MCQPEPKELHLLEWPNTTGITETVVERLQHSADVQNSYALLSGEEAWAIAPELHETVNAAITEHSPSNLLDELMCQAQAEVAETVIGRLSPKSRDQLTQAVLDRDKKQEY